MANKTMLAGIIIVVIVIAALLLFTYSNSSKSSPSTITSASSSAPTTYVSSTVYSTTALTTMPATTITTPANYSGAQVQSYINESQAISLFGANGTYSSIVEVNESNLTSFINTYSPFDYGLLAGNVTAGYEMQYFINETNVTASTGVYQITYKSPRALALYSAYVNQSGLDITNTTNMSDYTVFNATLNGMTYSYGALNASNSSYYGYFYYYEFIATKNNELTIMLIESGEYVNQNNIASVLSSDMSNDTSS